MAASTATVQSHSKDPRHYVVFVMGYDPDEPGVLHVRDAKSKPKSSKTQREVCMADHAAGGNKGPRISGTISEPQALRLGGNRPSTKEGGAPIQPSYRV